MPCNENGCDQHDYAIGAAAFCEFKWFQERRANTNQMEDRSAKKLHEVIDMFSELLEEVVELRKETGLDKQPRKVKEYKNQGGGYRWKH